MTIYEVYLKRKKEKHVSQLIMIKISSDSFCLGTVFLSHMSNETTLLAPDSENLSCHKMT